MIVRKRYENQKCRQHLVKRFEEMSQMLEQFCSCLPSWRSLGNVTFLCAVCWSAEIETVEAAHRSEG